jgi:hypothetical protein
LKVSKFLRQEGLVDTGSLLLTRVGVIGVGGIGSPTVLTLAKMGVGGIVVWDHDKVEEHNTGSQLYREQDIGLDKVAALREIVAGLTGKGIFTVPDKVGKETILDVPILVSALDSMSARYDLCEAIQRNTAVKLLVDVRAGAEELRFIVCPDMASYEETLYPDREALPLSCTARAIIYTGFMAAGIVASIIKAHVVKAITEPYQLAVDIPTMQVMRL